MHTEPGALEVTADAAARRARYEHVETTLLSLLAGETDLTAAFATVACELHWAFDYYDWTGFYRLVGPEELVVGPYQGHHGCLRITFDRGVCGTAARTRTTQLVPDVSARPDHISCNGGTRSEIVVPVLTPSGDLLAVLDVDSDTADAFSDADRDGLEAICAELGRLGAAHR